MAVLRMNQSTADEAMTVDQLLAEIQLAIDSGIITGQSKVVMSQLCGHNIWPIRAVIAPGQSQDDCDVVALSLEDEDELLASGKFV